MRKFSKKYVVIASACAFLVTACATPASNTQKGAGIGAVVGAIAGKGTGDNAKSRYVWGAALGALAGGAIGAYMDKQEQALKQELNDTGVEVIRQGDELILRIPGNLTFVTNGSAVAADFYPVLNDVAKVLVAYDKTKLNIVGHTDSTGDSQYNMDLSMKRANSVAAYLNQQGIIEARLRTSGMGQTSPIANNDTAESRQKNRRVELSIIPVTGS